MSEFEEKYLEEVKKQCEEYLNYLKERERKEEEQQKAIAKYGLFFAGLMFLAIIISLPLLL